jgi:hypothetical protein
LAAFNAEIMHMVVRIDGKNYGLITDWGGDVIVKEDPDKDSDFDWTYKGRLKRSNKEIKDAIKKINDCSHRYNIALTNC